MELIHLRKNDIISMSGVLSKSTIGGFDMTNGTGIQMTDTLYSAIERWLYKYKQASVKTASFNRLLESHRLLRKYRLANVRLIDLCTDDIQTFVTTLASDGYAITTIKKAFNLVTGFLRFAMGEGLAVRPAHLNVALPRPENIKKKAKEVVAYDPDEQRRIRDAICLEGTPGANAALLMMETGMRVGEVLGAKWSDIQWQRRAIRVHTTLVNLQSRKRCFVQDSAKSKSSTRTIPLSAKAMSMLMDARCSGDGLIFTAPDGKSTIGYNTLRNQMIRVCEIAGVEYHGAHAFRHTFATNCYYKGCDVKKLSKLLGHANVTITYNTYIHLYGDMLEELRSIVE